MINGKLLSRALVLIGVIVFVHSALYPPRNPIVLIAAALIVAAGIFIRLQSTRPA